MYTHIHMPVGAPKTLMMNVYCGVDKPAVVFTGIWAISGLHSGYSTYGSHGRFRWMIYDLL